MALFIVERNFAEALDKLGAEEITSINAINETCNVRWLNSFLSADRRKTYCLYEAINADDIREAARRANIPADAIMEISENVQPELILRGAT